MKQEGKRVFVMGDIHGACKALEQCLQRSGFDYQNDVLIQLGDIVDGYNQTYECVEELLKIKNLVAIKGNHDDWFESFLQTDFHPGYWNYGGKATIASYLEHASKPVVCFPSASGYKTSLNSSDIPASHRQFFNSQKVYYIDDEQRCFVHGGFNRNIPFDQQAQSMYYWDRDLWTDAIAHQDQGIAPENFEMDTQFKEIFIGHSATTNWGTDQPMTVMNITNLDTGAGHTGRLTIMEVNSRQFWQSDPVMELYDMDSRDLDGI